MNRSQNSIISTDGGHDHTRRVDLPVAIASTKLTIIDGVLRHDRLSRLQYGRGEEISTPVVDLWRGRSGCKNL